MSLAQGVRLCHKMQNLVWAVSETLKDWCFCENRRICGLSSVCDAVVLARVEPGEDCIVLTTMSPQISFQPIEVLTANQDREGCLMFVDGKLGSGARSPKRSGA